MPSDATATMTGLSNHHGSATTGSSTDDAPDGMTSRASEGVMSFNETVTFAPVDLVEEQECMSEKELRTWNRLLYMILNNLVSAVLLSVERKTD